MRKILLTGIGGDVACAILRSLMDVFPEDEFFGFDIREYTPYMEKLKEMTVAPRYTDSDYFEFVKRYLEEKGITHYLPTTEPEILIADQNRDFFKEKGICLMINHTELLRICTSKYRTADFLRKHGIRAPLSGMAKEVTLWDENGVTLPEGETIGYPLILKEDFGRGGHGMSLIRSKEDWERAGKDNYVCQEYLDGSEYTVGVFSDGEQIRSITYRRELGLGGMSVVVECVDIPEIRMIAEKTAKALDLCGSINLQLREHNGEYCIFEINPRLSSTTGFRHKMGFTDAVWWMRFLDGEGLRGDYKEPLGMKGVKVTDDVVYQR